MSFATIAQCTTDEVLGQRVRAAYAKEGADGVEQSWYTMRWQIAADPSIEAPYASALAAHNPNPGGDESVLTDGMITAAVQANPYEPIMPGPPA